ncbi:MAG: cobalamin biosynthesis protein [Actinomycetia bacterium]|nr:cobalamin biosynthesis protein [Actinomycetes bacterium]
MPEADRQDAVPVESGQAAAAPAAPAKPRQAAPAAPAEVCLLCFTIRGKRLADRLAAAISCIDGWAAVPIGIGRVTKLHEYTERLFKTGNLLIFVGAAGIAVRAITPFVWSKASDPAVLVIDEAGQFVIPILSGHLGGANHYASELASLIGAVPVITTATDINKVFSIDDYARKWGYAVANPKAIKHVAAAILEGRPVGFCSDFPVDGTLPPPLTAKEGGALGVSVSLDVDKRPFTTTLTLVPKCLHVGVGARKDADGEALKRFFSESLAAAGLPALAVTALCSIDLKAAEPAICALAQKLRVPFVTYRAAELDAVADLFERSDFVKATTGSGNVCEAAAYLSSGCGTMVLPKTVKDKCTLAVAKQDWRVSFEADNDRP